MSISIITTYENITINETLTEENIYDYINNVIEQFEDKNKVSIIMIINTGDKEIRIKIK